MIVPIVIFVILVAAAIAVFSYRNRSEKGIESGISSFRRELDALAPRQPAPPQGRPQAGVEPIGERSTDEPENADRADAATDGNADRGRPPSDGDDGTGASGDSDSSESADWSVEDDDRGP